MFQKYKYVLAVYQEQSFTGAAKKLFISQPSLSVAIRNVEKALGMPLFERSGSGIKLTEIGEAYIAAAQKMELAHDEFERKYADINSLQSGKLVVGGSNYLSTGVLPLIITRFRSRFPGVAITLIEANSVHLREMLCNEEVDIVIDNFEQSQNLYEKHPLINEQLLLCVPEDRPINQALKAFQITPETIYTDAMAVADKPSLDISLFKDEAFILLKSGNDMYHRATAIFEDSGIAPDVAFQVDQLNISCALAESKLGVCFVTDTFYKYRKRAGSVVLYKLDSQFANRMLQVAYKKKRYCTKAMAEFISVAQEVIRDGIAIA